MEIYWNLKLPEKILKNVQEKLLKELSQNFLDIPGATLGNFSEELMKAHGKFRMNFWKSFRKKKLSKKNYRVHSTIPGSHLEEFLWKNFGVTFLLLPRISGGIILIFFRRNLWKNFPIFQVVLISKNPGEIPFKVFEWTSERLSEEVRKKNPKEIPKTI